MKKITALINFCSNEYPFLKHCIFHLQPFCHQIVISVCDHFYDGKKEEPETLQSIYAEFPEVTFVQYPYLGNCISKRTKRKKGDRIFDGISRYMGALHLDPLTEYVLFIDADEIVDTKRFIDFFCSFPIENYQALKLSNYWYFREPSFQAKSYEESLLLVQKGSLTKKILFGPEDREGIFQRVSGSKKRSVVGLDDQPLFYHYSWVRTKEQMLRKVLSWGHRNERDWKSLVEKEFSHSFTGKDFVHGYEFTTVKPYLKIDLEQEPLPLCKNSPENCVVISKKKALRALSFFLWFRSLWES